MILKIKDKNLKPKTSALEFHIFSENPINLVKQINLVKLILVFPYACKNEEGRLLNCYVDITIILIYKREI